MPSRHGAPQVTDGLARVQGLQCRTSRSFVSLSFAFALAFLLCVGRAVSYLTMIKPLLWVSLAATSVRAVKTPVVALNSLWRMNGNTSTSTSGTAFSCGIEYSQALILQEGADATLVFRGSFLETCTVISHLTTG